MDCSPPGPSVHGILQARTLEWVPCPPLRDILYPGIKTVSLRSPALAGGFFTTAATWKGHLLREEPGKKPVAFWHGLCHAAFHSSLVTPFKGWRKNYFFISQHCAHSILVIIINRGNILHFFFLSEVQLLCPSKSSASCLVLPWGQMDEEFFSLWSFPWTNKSTYCDPQLNCSDISFWRALSMTSWSFLLGDFSFSGENVLIHCIIFCWHLSLLDLKVTPTLIHSKRSLHWKWLRWKYIFVIKLMTYEGKTILWY